MNCAHLSQKEFMPPMRFTMPMMNPMIPKKKQKQILEGRGKIKGCEFQNSSSVLAAA